MLEVKIKQEKENSFASGTLNFPLINSKPEALFGIIHLSHELCVWTHKRVSISFLLPLFFFLTVEAEVVVGDEAGSSSVGLDDSEGGKSGHHRGRCTGRLLWQGRRWLWPSSHVRRWLGAEQTDGERALALVRGAARLR